jgi:N-sulfoglucosamine sulfohydrolase
MKRALLGFMLMLLAPLSALGASEPVAQPNILFLLADDWGWPHASCLGDPVIKTPTFDRIAREGVMFRNAYSTSPSCSPSRASILTGQWPGRLDQGASLLTFLPVRFAVYPDLLEKAGYFVGATGKGYAPAKSIGWKHNPAGANYRDFDQFLAQRPKGTPFCYWFGSRHPHRPYQPGCGIKSGMDPAKVPVPPDLPPPPLYEFWCVRCESTKCFEDCVGTDNDYLVRPDDPNFKTKGIPWVVGATKKWYTCECPKGHACGDQPNSGMANV